MAKCLSTVHALCGQQVAEELLEDIKREASRARAKGLASEGGHAVDERNVRRRVYDALNVLMAAGVVEKDAAAKKVFWKGSMNEMSQLEALEVSIRALLSVPSTTLDAKCLQKEFDARVSKLAAKRKMVKGLLLHQCAVKLLVQRNQVVEATVVPGQTREHGCKLHIPFAVVSAPDSASFFLQLHTPRDLSLTCEAPCAVTTEAAVLAQLGVTNARSSCLLSIHLLNFDCIACADRARGYRRDLLDSLQPFSWNIRFEAAERSNAVLVDSVLKYPPLIDTLSLLADPTRVHHASFWIFQAFGFTISEPWCCRLCTGLIGLRAFVGCYRIRSSISPSMPPAAKSRLSSRIAETPEGGSAGDFSSRLRVLAASVRSSACDLRDERN
jgi:hypothetical protein